MLEVGTPLVQLEAVDQSVSVVPIQLVCAASGRPEKLQMMKINGKSFIINEFVAPLSWIGNGCT